MNKPRGKRIYFDVDDETHKQIKILAADRNIMMKTYVLRAIIKQIREDLKRDAGS